jgi:hypothetical protein
VGSRKTDAVLNSSATAAFGPRLLFELRAGLGRHFGDGLLLKGRCGSALARRKLGYDVFLVILWLRQSNFYHLGQKTFATLPLVH